MTWHIYPVQEFHRFVDTWQEICEQSYQNHPLLSKHFVVPLVNHFSDDKVYIAVDETPTQVDGLALISKGGKGKWVTFYPSQSPLALCLFRNPASFSSFAKNLINQLPGLTWSFVVFHYDPKYLPLLGDNKSCIRTSGYGSTMEIEIDGEFESYWQARSKNLRRNIKRYRNRLSKANISIRIEEITNPGDMAMAIARYGDIESAGWKAEKGTAIHADNVQGAFYQRVLENFANSGNASVYFMYFNEQIVAARLMIANLNMSVILKTTYDETFSQYAPGRLLLYLILEQLFAQDNKRCVEFYTQASSDQLQWSTGKRMIYHVDFYRYSLFKPLITLLHKIRP